MLLLRYPGEHAAQAALEAAPKADGDAPQVELVFESARSGKRRVIGPAKGVAAMAKSDVVSWGLFGVVYGAIVGAVGNGGILSSIENGVVTGVLWAIFGPRRRRPLRPLGGTRGVRPATERSRAAAAARQLGDPRLGRWRRHGADDRSTVDARRGDTGPAFQPLARGAILEV